ncbi:Putative F-box domain-containing protein [Septoria linicola]|uniref:F-box domain-containing protein n=1 Tax=Septoria linicola TaxID=215465 RepID=A0A9Q9APB4_9PEZI|nr:putative F-box domain-containing protein [Septoria linicola]USW52610.1 Putative F-box domain-containing protein [Septoria linicola]
MFEVDVLRREIATLRAENARLRAAHDLALAGNHRQRANVLSLPTELLDKVFTQLSEQRTDIAACRLVCRDFRDVSSPYLITTVTFSRRMDTLSKLFDILDHPYFSQHVTNLVWDASQWDEDMAFDLDEYNSNAHNSGRSYTDKTAKAEAKTWKALWSRICKHSQDEPDPSLPDFGELDENNVYALACQNSYLLGQYQYSRFWLAQKAMVDRDVPEDTLWAYRDRDYDRFCRRTLGHASPPRHLCNEEIDDGVIYQDLWMIFEQLAMEDSPALKSFAIGSNPFGVPLSDCGRLAVWEDDLPQALSHRHISSGDPTIDISDALIAFEHVRELRLPQRFDYMNDEDGEHIEWTIKTSYMPQLLSTCAEHLVKLIFTAEDLVYFRSRSAEGMRWDVKEGGAIALEKLLYPLTFKRLRCLDLRGWPLRKELFSAFLQRHKATLRQMRLINNLVTDGDTKADHALASSVGPKLSLLGIAVNNRPPDWRQPLDALNSAHCRPDGKQCYTEIQRRELEDLWLQGRYNVLQTVTLQQKSRLQYAELTTWREMEGWAE